jgi:alkanesulfonate monooxygenase SsuD/methylene tetrahydromethanopterin reductase-like flavin-dependent oxidoreductase (luciferase family)
VRHLDEYLDSLLPLLAGESVRSTGEIVTTRGALRMPGAAPPPVYVAALGPQLLSVAGRRAAGTITWMTGPRTLASHIGPGIRAAAHRAGRSVEVVAIVPVCVTDDPERARAVAAERYAPYNDLPSYRAMLDREGAGGPEDVAVVGHEEAVRRALATLDAAGVDEVVADVFGSADEMARTRALLLGTVAAAGNGGRRPGSWT